VLFSFAVFNSRTQPIFIGTLVVFELATWRPKCPSVLKVQVKLGTQTFPYPYLSFAE